MHLSAYLSRIGYDGPLACDLDTLFALHRAHLLAIPYEDIDVQLGRRLTVDPAEAFDKLVTRRRGGWCYEMNSLFAWALGEIGFDIARMAGEVMREERNPGAIGGHMVLRVQVDGRPWIADVGFGNGLRAPIPFLEGDYPQGDVTFRLERMQGGWWRFHNHATASAAYCDFLDEVADISVFATACERQQDSPTSVFVQNLICQQLGPKGVTLLLGRVLRRAGAQPHEVTILDSAEALVATLRSEFGVDLPQAAQLWPKICARHEALFPPQPESTIAS
jgi:N-hydroxyarylamine O-acetyltransferase